MELYRLLVVSPPTIDVIGDRCRVGGPAVYAGAVFRRLGGLAYAVGPVGFRTLGTVWVERRLGVWRLGYYYGGEGLVFNIKYLGGGRRIVSLESSTNGLDPSVVLSASSGLGLLDAVLLSPLYGEEWGMLAPLLSARSRLVAVDVQGYVRAGLDPSPTSGGAVLVHASRGEVGEGLPILYYVETDGPGDIILVERSGMRLVARPRGGLLRDPTGAGDAYTASLLYYLLEGYPVEDSLELASEVVYSVLPSIQEELWLEDCSL